jgi:hypothetical protein
MAEHKPISIFDAEQKVREFANNELVEDRVYELAQDLVNKYIGKVEEEFAITDENGDGTMWYDDVREDAMKIIFEKLDAFFKGN